MMVNISIIISLLTFFYLLGKAADLVIYNIRILGEKLGIKIFFLGILLGLFTSLPELAVGLNATIKNISPLAVGNLFGGIIVLFSLVLGVSIVLNRKINASEKLTNFFLIFAYFLLPLFLSLNGYLSSLEGIALIIIYFLLIFYLYWQQKHQSLLAGKIIINKNKLLKNILLVILGLVLVVIISNIIIRFTEALLEYWAVPAFLVGLILFSFGTNLPEIIVTIRSWRRHIKDLSLSNLLGSGMANILILGFLIFLKPVFLQINLIYYSLMFFMVILLLLVVIFYRTGRRLTQKEGMVVLTIYFLFLATQLAFIYLKVID